MDDEAETNKRQRFLFGKTALFLIMTSYALIGAVIFKFLEENGEHPLQTPTYVQKSREDCLKELWLITGECDFSFKFN